MTGVTSGMWLACHGSRLRAAGCRLRALSGFRAWPARSPTRPVARSPQPVADCLVHPLPESFEQIRLARAAAVYGAEYPVETLVAPQRLVVLRREGLQPL